MELTQLRYFLEVAESEHMTMSAEKLHIAQPALSQSIHRLEKELGVPLFEKQGRNIVLTSCGRQMQKRILPLLRELDALPDELQAIAHCEQHTVYINVLAASSLLTKAIIQYQEKNKEVNFKLLQNNTSDNFDIQVTTKLFFQQPEGSKNTHYVYNEKIFLAVPNNERFCKRKSVALKEVAEEGFIGLYGSRQFRYICDKFCHYAGIAPRYIFESDNPAAVQNMIAANIGIGFWPEHSWGEIANRNIRLLPIREPECSRDIVISYNHKSGSMYAGEFFRFLTGLLR